MGKTTVAPDRKEYCRPCFELLFHDDGATWEGQLWLKKKAGTCSHCAEKGETTLYRPNESN